MEIDGLNQHNVEISADLKQQDGNDVKFVQKVEREIIIGEPNSCNENDPELAVCSASLTQADKTLKRNSRSRRKRCNNQASNAGSASKQKMYESDNIIREVSPDRLKDNETSLLVATAEAEQESRDSELAMDTENTTVGSKKVDYLLVQKTTVQCNICKKVMVESRLANHIRLLHVEDTQENSQEKKKEFKCEHCGKLYATRYIYVQHIRNHEEGRPKCPECGSTFASAFTLFRHRAKTHNIEHHYTTYSCEQCDKNFFSSSELKLHQQRHSDQKDFKCGECEKEFAVKGNLRIHMRTHAKTKLYKCDICNNSFSHPYSLTSHRRIHTNDFPYKCSECDKACRSRHQLTSHKNVHSDLRPFQCTQCSKSFKSRTAFKTHQDEHQGIKRFVCQFCERQFQCYGNKLKHERRHIGDKKHKCSVCPKGFIEKQELRNHMRIHDRNQYRINDSSQTKDTVAEQDDSMQVKIEEQGLGANENMSVDVKTDLS